MEILTLMFRELNSWFPTLSKKRPTTSHVESLNTKCTMYGVGDPGPDLRGS
jgi:hypothetical protein